MNRDELLELIGDEPNKTSNPSLPKQTKDKDVEDVINVFAQNWTTDGSSESTKADLSVDELLKKIEEQEDEISVLKGTKKPKIKLVVRNNIEKIKRAIITEAGIQDDPNPQIGYSKMITIYKLNPNHYKESVELGEKMGEFKREDVAYSSNVKTYRWCIPKSH